MSLRYSDLKAGELVSFPLHALLILYGTGPSHLYCDNLYGLRVLIDWLGPIGIPEMEHVPIPRLKGNYDVQRIAQILDCPESTVYQVVNLLWD